MKPNPQKEAERWLKQAQNDLAAAYTLLGNGFHAQACFFSQQVAEKALKALVYFQGARFVLEHSVKEILQGLVIRYPQLAKHAETAGRLDLYYLSPRYPNAVPGLAPFQVFTKEQAKEAVDGAGAIVREVELALEQKQGGA